MRPRPAVMRVLLPILDPRRPMRLWGDARAIVVTLGLDPGRAERILDMEVRCRCGPPTW